MSISREGGASIPYCLPVRQAYALRGSGILLKLRDLFTSRETKIRECARALLNIASSPYPQPKEEPPAPLHDRLWRVSDKSWVCQSIDSQGHVQKVLLRLPTGAHGPAAYNLVIQSIQLLKQQLDHANPQVVRDGIIFTNPAGTQQEGVWLLDPIRTKPNRLNQGILRFDVRKVLPSGSATIEGPEDLHLAAPVDELSPGILENPGFSDSFTQLATQCLHRFDSHFIEGKRPAGDYRFVIGAGGTLQLAEVTPHDGAPTEQEKMQNRTVLNRYRFFLNKTYGQGFVKKLELAYEIDFDRMYEEGAPLYPDHVFKCNIGVHNISIHDVQETFDRLKEMRRLLPPNDSLPAETFLYSLLTDGSFPDVSVREARKLLLSLKQTYKKDHPTVADLSNFLSQITEDSSSKPVQTLAPTNFNALLHLLVSDTAELDRAFTGREFTEQAVSGGPARGSTRHIDPCKSLFEMLQIFQNCRKSDNYNKYYELLAQVAIKKIPLQPNPNPIEAQQRETLLGFLIPAPVSRSGEEHWYTASYFQDDAGGNVNFGLQPSCEGYREGAKRLPLIKLYRSTVPSPYAQSWVDSLSADLNPEHAPGALDPRLSVPYEIRYFNERTIPSWVAYMTAASNLPEENVQRHQFLEKAIASFQRYIANEKTDLSPDPTPHLMQLLNERRHDELIIELQRKAKDWGEDPESKIAQDISFVGHSLGGTLAQQNMWDLVWKQDRVVLPGCEMLCSAFDAPSVSRQTNDSFMRFGHEHAELLKALDIKTTVKYQFEHGDFIPLAGQSHLGISIEHGAAEPEPWLNFSANVFRPLPEATDPAITTLGKHSRRIGFAQPDVDYELTPITYAELRAHDHSLFLRRPVAKKFGHNLLRAARIIEFARRRLGFLGRLILRRFENVQYGISRDPNRVYAIDEGHGYGVQTYTPGKAT